MEPCTKKQRLAESAIFKPSIHQPVAPFKTFPPEILEMVFENAATADLFNLRQVNYQWNEIATRVLRGRNDMPIHFILSDGVYLKKSRHRCRQCSLNLRKPTCTLGARSLTDLVAFLTKSPLFPGTSFRFDDLSNESCEGLTSFLGIWGSRVSTFRVSTSDSAENVMILMKLLLGRIPNLNDFKISHNSDDLPPISSSILPSTADSQFHLPKLKVFCAFDTPRKYRLMVEEILTASPNLQQFSIADSYVLLTDLEMLHRSQKLHCLKDLRILITEGLITDWKKSQNKNLFKLRLRSLILRIDENIYLDDELKCSAATTLTQFFHFNGNTIETLNTEPMGPLTQLVFPKFKQLQKLILKQEEIHAKYLMFPVSFNWFNTFPNMKKLDIEFLSGAYDMLFDDSLKTLPSIESLRVSLDRNRFAFGELIKRTPNVKTLIIRDDHSFWWEPAQSLNFEDIATYLPKLKTFCWQLRNYESLRYKMDALITGLPLNFCKKFAGKFRDVNNLNATEVSGYWKRCNPSILDLKGLRNLHINFAKSCSSLYNISDDDDSDDENESKNRDKAGFDSDSAYYKTGLTKVSKLLAFDQMPNLQIEIHKTKWSINEASVIID